jgi:hypothetical protein
MNDISQTEEINMMNAYTHNHNEKVTAFKMPCYNNNERIFVGLCGYKMV